MEGPAVRRALGDVTALRVLDAGCGDGGHALDMLEAGAAHVTAFDASLAMVERARALLAGYDAQVLRSDLETFELPPSSFDVVVARLCLHYVVDLDGVLQRLAAALVPDGKLIVTAVHPMLTAPQSPTVGQQRETWLVDDYFSTGIRKRQWLGGQMTWYHRTVEQWVQALLGAGLLLTALSDCPPEPELFADSPDELRRRLRVPSILLLAGQLAPWQQDS